MVDIGQAPPPHMGGVPPHMGDQKEPFYMRMTPMELDVQLQSAEMVFRSVLEGKRMPMAPHEDMEAWEKDVLGSEWCSQNEQQREEVLRQVKSKGENTPAWMESVGHMGDISWEVFDAGDNGERIRPAESMDRTEILEQFKDLKHKVEMSYFAQCGAGDRLFGFRACIALFRTAIRDSELMNLMVAVLIACIRDNQYNRDALTCLTVPAPPLERGKDFKDRGWSFLRNALDAFVVQAGGAGFSKQEPSSAGDEKQDRIPDSCSKDVAVLIAECLVLSRKAPAVLAQLKLVHEDPPADCWCERRELREIIPVAKQTCEELMKERSSEFLVGLKEMLVEGEEYMARLSAAASSAPAPSEE